MDNEDQYLITEQVFDTLAEGKDQILAVTPLGSVLAPDDLRPALTYPDAESTLVTGFLIHSEGGPVYEVQIRDTQASQVAYLLDCELDMPSLRLYARLEDAQADGLVFFQAGDPDRDFSWHFHHLDTDPDADHWQLACAFPRNDDCARIYQFPVHRSTQGVFRLEGERITTVGFGLSPDAAPSPPAP